MLIDKYFSRVLVTIQLLISQPSYQPTIDNEAQIMNRRGSAGKKTKATQHAGGQSVTKATQHAGG
jgi:hypothetical protein